MFLSNTSCQVSLGKCISVFHYKSSYKVKIYQRFSLRILLHEMKMYQRFSLRILLYEMGSWMPQYKSGFTFMNKRHLLYYYPSCYLPCGHSPVYTVHEH